MMIDLNYGNAVARSVHWITCSAIRVQLFCLLGSTHRSGGHICSQLSTLAVITYNDSRPTQQPSDDLPTKVYGLQGDNAAFRQLWDLCNVNLILRHPRQSSLSNTLTSPHSSREISLFHVFFFFFLSKGYKIQKSRDVTFFHNHIGSLWDRWNWHLATCVPRKVVFRIHSAFQSTQVSDFW